MNVRATLRRKLLTESEEKRIAMNIDIPEDIRLIEKVFKANGKKLFVVGGSIRDAILGKEPKDWDLATDALPDEVINILKSQNFITNIIETGKSFGVINALTANDEYEIATFRRDSASGDGRRPDSVEFTDIATDVKRRDLTINALFYDLDTNEVVDLVGGVEDLKNGIVKTVGDAGERFEEDKLRILRAIRFAGRFGSQVDDKIDQLLSKGVDLSQISGERIRDEFIKGISKAKSTVQFLELMNKYDLLSHVFPALIPKAGANSKTFMESHDPTLVVASILLPFATSKLRNQLNELKYSSEESSNIEFLTTWLPNLNPNFINQFKKKQVRTSLGDEQIMEFAKFNSMDVNLIGTMLNFDLSVRGDEVMSKFGVKGKEVGSMIDKLEADNFRSKLNN